jgi:hypothetical protein
MTPWNVVLYSTEGDYFSPQSPHTWICLILAQVWNSYHVGNQALAFDTICEHFQWTTPMQWINLELWHISFRKSVLSLVLHWHSSIICWTSQCDHHHGCLVWPFANFSSFSDIYLQYTFTTALCHLAVTFNWSNMFHYNNSVTLWTLHGTKFPVSLPLHINIYP